jgi:hypothetical protein
MQFSENGFLGIDAIRASERYRNEHAEFFDHFTAVNRASHQFINTCILDTRDGQQQFVSGLFLRSLTVFQAMLILTERGIASEVMTMLRSLLELRFQIHAIIADPFVAKRLIFRAEKNVKARLAALEKEEWLHDANPNRQPPQDRLEIQTASLDAMEKDILAERPALKNKHGRLKSIEIKELATIAEMKTDYEIVYSYLCDAAHSSSRYLEEMGSADGNSKFIGFSYPHIDQHILRYCHSGAGLHLDNLKSTADILKTKLPTEFAKLAEQHQTLRTKLKV